MDEINFFPENLNVQNQKIILRLDLNVPLKDKVIQDDTRISLCLPFIKKLVEKKAKIIIVSHLGRPKGIRVPDLSLIPVYKYLKKSIVIGRSKLRRIISYSCTLISRIIISNKINDFSNSYRFYKRKCIEEILKKKIIYQSPIQHLENLIILIDNGFKIKELPTKYIERERGQSSIKVVGLFFYMLDFFHCLARYCKKKLFS